MDSTHFLLLSMLSIGTSAATAINDKGSAIFTDLKLEIVDGHAIAYQVSDLDLRITLPFDEARSSDTAANTTDLWRVKAWASTLRQGGGEKVGFEKQILSESQAGTPLDISNNPMVIDEVVYSLDLVGHDCSVATFVCIRFQAWENGPEVLFEYENGIEIERGTTCVPVNCTGSVLFTGFKLEIVDGYAIADQVSDIYLRITLPFDEARSSATQTDVTDIWRAKAWASTLKRGGGQKVGFEKQILSGAQAGTPLDKSQNPMVIDDISYLLDLVGHDCSVATYVCVRFQAWENGPEVLFAYENREENERGTECVPLICKADNSESSWLQE